MALSHDLLKLIAALDRSTLPVDYLIDELAELGADDPLQRTQEEQSEDEDTTIEIRKLVELIVHAGQVRRVLENQSGMHSVPEY